MKINQVVRVGLAVCVAVLAGACSKEVVPLTPVEAARAKVKKAEEERQARDIINSMMSQPINCAESDKNAYAPETEASAVWVTRNKEGKLECFNTPGHHRTLRKELTGITRDEVEEIETHQDLYPPRPKVIIEPQTYIIKRPTPIVIAPRPIIILDEECPSSVCRL